VELLACVVVLKAYKMYLRGAECTTCCAVRSTTVESFNNFIIKLLKSGFSVHLLVYKVISIFLV
jgi:hypothetical protein